LINTQKNLQVSNHHKQQSFGKIVASKIFTNKNKTKAKTIHVFLPPHLNSTLSPMYKIEQYKQNKTSKIK
jgi:hypothetical protein